MRRVLLLAAVLVGVMAAPAYAADKDCGDFTLRSDAQAYFEAHGGSATNNVDRLDANHNGLACESLPGEGGDGLDESGPSEGKSLPFTGPSSSTLPAGVVLLAGGSLLVVATRYRARHGRR